MNIVEMSEKRHVSVNNISCYKLLFNMFVHSCLCFKITPYIKDLFVWFQIYFENYNKK